ncbi:sec-independent protein translocase protein TATB, chloroplastic-like [Durio zibethinus]|uniref:Sec-independent protein translocase protein TATB, chloroplastic-like n=1 Tax=Durio zibethinus TaxID=66656 RepID=A0A6P5YFL8_DURZI|nr:sec-independent protein translocase protein TATB, chloroplastic-like [Durio zibethinus]
MTTGMVMASTVSTAAFLFTSSVSSKSTNCSLSPLVSCSKASTFRLYKWFPQLGPSLFSQWSGLKHLSISISPKSVKLEKIRRSKVKVVHASLFGVGAPEALVIGVVALLVFGPKGLAEVARNLGKTLRAFQPTIRELQEVSREFKSTLEREIGLDEMSSSTQNTLNRNSPYLSNSTPTPLSVASTEESGTKADPNGTSSVNEAYTSEEYLKIAQEQLKASASQQQGQTASPGESQLEFQNQHEATPKETAAAMPPSQKPENESRNPMK